MAELIDRVETLRRLNERFEEFRPRKNLHDIAVCAGINEAIRIVEDMTPSDAAPVVRCKDCANASMTMNDELKYCKFWQPDGGDALYLPGDFFCREGKRQIASERMDADHIGEVTEMVDADAPERAEGGEHGKSSP